MIELLIFYLHVLGATYAFVRQWQREGLRQGALAVLIIALAFTILWAITGSIAGVIVPEKGWAPWFTRDTMSLVLVFIPDTVFFVIFFLSDKHGQNGSEPGTSKASDS